MAEGSGTILAMRGIEKRFGDVRALDNVAFDLRAGKSMRCWA